MISLLRKIPVAKTPSGASSASAAMVILLLGCLNGWAWWAHQSTAVQTAAATILAYVFAQLAAWWNVVRAPGQEVTVKPSASRLPTVQASDPPQDVLG